MAAFQAEWPAWADEQARLEKAENDARDAFNLADFALSQSIAETSALAAKDPTRASQQLAAEMATVEERLRDLASQEKENSDRLETMSKKVEDDGEACANLRQTLEPSWPRHRRNFPSNRLPLWPIEWQRRFPPAALFVDNAVPPPIFVFLLALNKQVWMP
jgi:hypothetical protein